ncbi:hypothetical protein [uncultured Arcobacter sp.]|uniref:hypothetical protein n=1 Tax=uncultured Arcobacter sp. TaxID=165434 RepID=UPI002605349A|nr:hypothetical protein [uncultured Arcobacter sp.]
MTKEIIDGIEQGICGVTDLTEGSVLFKGSAVISEDNSNLYWDNTNKRLGLGLTNPSELLEVAGNIAVSGTVDGIDIATDVAANTAARHTAVTPGGSTTQVQFNNSGSFGGSSDLTWDNTSGLLGIGAAANDVQCEITTDYENTGIGNSLNVNYFRNHLAGGALRMHKGRGTAAAPLRAQAEDTLGGLNAFGYYASSDVATASKSTGAQGQFLFKAAEDFTSTSKETYFKIALTPSGFTGSGGLEQFRINANGDAIISNDLIVKTSHTPSSASDTGITGTIAWDSNYIYICIATNTWKRVAIDTW